MKISSINTYQRSNIQKTTSFGLMTEDARKVYTNMLKDTKDKELVKTMGVILESINASKFISLDKNNESTCKGKIVNENVLTQNNPKASMEYKKLEQKGIFKNIDLAKLITIYQSIMQHELK